MSRPGVSNQYEFDRILVQASTNGAASGHRALVVVEDTCTHWLENYALSRHIPWVAADSLTDRSDRITALLGQEHDLLAHQPAQPMDAGLLAALAGTVKAGGVLILGLAGDSRPPGSAVESTTTQASGSICHSVVLSPDRFNKRLFRLLLHYATTHPETIIRVALSNEAIAQPIQTPALPVIDPPVAPSLRIAAQQEQDRCLSSARQYLHQHERGCITLVGKRGRGKSTLLARLANALNCEGIAYDIATLRESALQSFRRRLDHTAPRWLPAAQQSSLSSDRVLLVDEAGNLPLSVLMTLLEQRRQVVFCTTVEGYESAGRAFDVRFLSALAERYPQALHLQPTLPWRWAEGDPLDALISQLTLANAAAPRVSLDSATEQWAASDRLHAQMRVRHISQSELADDERLLEAVFGLLRDTHYQTTVADLQHLLEGGDTELWVGELPVGTAPASTAPAGTATIGAEPEGPEGEPIGEPIGEPVVVAVLLLSVEGNIDAQLHNSVLRRQRRLPHHLLPQLLAQMSDSSQPLSCRFGRVVRISVVASLRRHRLATALLKAVENSLVLRTPDQPVHALGASFASDPASLGFWQANGYEVFHRGFRQNPRTGARAVAVVKSSYAPLLTCIRTAIAIYQDNQQWLESRPPSTLASQCSGAMADYDDVAVLKAFAEGRRSANDSYAALARLEHRQLLSLEKPPEHSQRTHERRLQSQVSNLLNNAYNELY